MFITELPPKNNLLVQFFFLFLSLFKWLTYNSSLAISKLKFSADKYPVIVLFITFTPNMACPDHSGLIRGHYGRT